MNVDLNFHNIAAITFIVFATFVLLRALGNIVSAFESKNWQETSGVILSSRVKESWDAEGGMFQARVAYRYRALDQEFTGQRACFGDSTATSIPALARRIAAKYRAGQAVTVRYNPSKPEECVLESGMNGHLLFDLAVGCMFLIIGIYAL